MNKLPERPAQLRFSRTGGWPNVLEKARENVAAEENPMRSKVWAIGARFSHGSRRALVGDCLR